MTCPMKMYTLNETRKKVALVDQMVTDGYFPSRSEAVRFAIYLLIEYMKDEQTPLPTLQEAYPETPETAADGTREIRGNLIMEFRAEVAQWVNIGRVQG